MSKFEPTEDDLKKGEILIRMAGAFFKEYTEGTLETIVKAIRKYPVEAIERAAEVLIIESKRLPLISDLTDQAENFVDWSNVGQAAVDRLDETPARSQAEYDAWIEEMEDGTR